jgi:hypothetical protein
MIENFYYVVKVIRSCQTLPQLMNATSWAYGWSKASLPKSDMIDLLSYSIEMQRKEIMLKRDI